MKNYPFPSFAHLPQKNHYILHIFYIHHLLGEKSPPPKPSKQYNCEFLSSESITCFTKMPPPKPSKQYNCEFLYHLNPNVSKTVSCQKFLFKLCCRMSTIKVFQSLIEKMCFNIFLLISHFTFCNIDLSRLNFLIPKRVKKHSFVKAKWAQKIRFVKVHSQSWQFNCCIID